MTWEILNYIGTAAFAASGAVIATKVRYDIFGVYILGFITAFGGGMIRNVLLGIPLNELWEKHGLFLVALGIITVIIVLPRLWGRYQKIWIFFDAVGLAAFSVQGAHLAAELGSPLIGIIAAAVLTGCGGGVVRDVLARMKPLVFRNEIYAVWSILGGLMIGLRWADQEWELYVLSFIIVIARLISAYFQWGLPKAANPKEGGLIKGGNARQQ